MEDVVAPLVSIYFLACPFHFFLRVLVVAFVGCTYFSLQLGIVCFGFSEEVWLEDGLIFGPIGCNGMAWVLFLMAYSLSGFFLASLIPSLLSTLWCLFSNSRYWVATASCCLLPSSSRVVVVQSKFLLSSWVVTDLLLRQNGLVDVVAPLVFVCFLAYPLHFFLRVLAMAFVGSACFSLQLVSVCFWFGWRMGLFMVLLGIMGWLGCSFC